MCKQYIDTTSVESSSDEECLGRSERVKQKKHDEDFCEGIVKVLHLK